MNHGFRSLLRLSRQTGMGNLRKVYHTVGGRVAKRLGLKRTPFLPTSIDVEPIDTCNFACDHCQVTHWTRKTTRLTTERFVSILRQLPMLRQIKLQGMGEPLLNRHLIQMLEEGERWGGAIFVVTNGSVIPRVSPSSSLRGTTIIIEALALWRLFGWRGSSGRWRGLVPAPRSGPTAGEDGAAGRPKGVFRGPRTGMIVIRGRAGAVVPRPAADGAERAARRRRGGASRCRRTPAPPASASGRGVRPWRRPAPATSSRTPPAPPASSSSPCRG